MFQRHQPVVKNPLAFHIVLMCIVAQKNRCDTRYLTKLQFDS